ARESWAQLLAALAEIVPRADAAAPGCGWFKTRKARGYGKFDNHSHGAPHKSNSKEFWATRAPFQEKYKLKFEGFGDGAPADAAVLRKQTEAHFEMLRHVLRETPG